jgi:hypothetical protein
VGRQPNDHLGRSCFWPQLFEHRRQILRDCLKSNTHTNGDFDSNSNGDSHRNTDDNSNGDSDSYSDRHTESHTDAEAYTDTEAAPDSSTTTLVAQAG